MGKLTATKIAAIREPGRYQDGDGLMLIVGASGSRSWVVRVKQPGKAGRRLDVGIGSLKDVGLADARKRAAIVRAQVKNGERVNKPWERELDPVPTFKDAATRLHGELKRSWTNGKHQAQWLSTLEAYVFPKLGSRTVDTIEPGDIRDVLLAIWLEVPETARRVRQRIGAVLDWAHAHGYRPTEAPMRAVNRTLPKQPRRDGHFAALPYSGVPAFVRRLREQESMSRLTLEALILTATRPGEVRGARWSELDFEAATWTIPADRMKAGKQHVVPLSPAAVRVFERAREIASSATLVFPGRDGRKPQSDMTLTRLMRDMGVAETAHGFRSAFRDWAAEETKFPGEVAEAALAHAIPNKVEAAYRRTDFLAKRREMMEAWAKYIEGTPAAVVSLPTGRSRTNSAA